ncbi:hypothetical protein KKA53_02995 [Candidatus Dependentiae bacterium]|nr:hypothetical protein [Candidatus Dependentiae bacterium]
MNRQTTNPTRLFVGDEQKLDVTITKQLQKKFCKQSFEDDCFCNECRKIKNGQHQSIIWIEPEKKYLLDDLTVIFKTIRFQLEQNQSFFFILKKAHHLSPVCANKLLKTLEEPPPGYTFFLLTNNEQAILPTIRSRCSINHIKRSSSSLLLHPLLTFFIDPQKKQDPFLFDQELKKQKPTEQETVDLLEDLTNSIQKRLQQSYGTCYNANDLERLAHDKKHSHQKKTLDFLLEQTRKPPQPGSSSLFWKNLFINYPK